MHAALRQVRRAEKNCAVSSAKLIKRNAANSSYRIAVEKLPERQELRSFFDAGLRPERTFHFPFIFQLGAPSNLLSAAVPAR